MGRWVAACLFLGALGLASARLWVEPARDSWNVVVAGTDGSVAWFRFTVSNTGVFANEETTRLAVIRRDTFPLEHRAIGGPAQIDSRGVSGVVDLVALEKESWTWNVGGEAVRSSGRVDGQSDPCPSGVGTAAGFLDVPNVSAAAAEGGIIRGPALVFRTLEGTQTGGFALYALAPNGAVRIDPASACPALLVTATTFWEGEHALSALSAGGRGEWALGSHRVVVQTGSRMVNQSPKDTTLFGERVLAALAGFPLPTITIRQAEVWVDDNTAPWPAVWVERLPLPRAAR